MTDRTDSIGLGLPASQAASQPTSECQLVSTHDAVAIISF